VALHRRDAVLKRGDRVPDLEREDEIEAVHLQLDLALEAGKAP